MGRFIRRVLLLFIIHICVYICFPYTAGENAFILMMSLLAWLTGLIIFSFVFYFIGLSRSKFFNFLFEMFIIFGSLYLLLNIYPQRDGVSPMEKITQHKYPKYEDIRYGISKLGVDLPTKQVVKQEYNETMEIIPEIKESISNHIDKDSPNND